MMEDALRDWLDHYEGDLDATQQALVEASFAAGWMDGRLTLLEECLVSYTVSEDDDESKD